MDIVLKIQGNIHNLMRQCGYYFAKEEKGQLAFCRIIDSSKSGYPRFHAYIKFDEIPQQTQINLHLDQKKPIYQKTPAHSAKYEGELIEKEAARIKRIMGS